MCSADLHCSRALPRLETDSLVFLVVRACAAHAVPETALPSCSQPFSHHCVLLGALSLNLLSHCRLARLDVVVHAEKVRGVVFILESNEAVVIAAVRLAGDGVALVGDVVSVGSCD